MAAAVPESYSAAADLAARGQIIALSNLGKFGARFDGYNDAVFKSLLAKELLVLHQWLATGTCLLMLTATQMAIAATPATGIVHGHLEDAVTRRPISRAVIRLLRGGQTAGSGQSDAQGRFTFKDVPEGVYEVEVNAPGHMKAMQADVRVVLNKAAAVSFSLVQDQHGALEEVVVSARAVSDDPRSTPNTVLLDREEIRRNPGSAGDVFRALDMMPGVVATGEFSNFTVRGNGPRDNLITIDGLPFDKVTHFDQGLGEQEDIAGGGRYSIFAPNLVGSAKFSPGGWRAYEGGKFGSLLELEVAEGNSASSTIGTQIDFGGFEGSYDGPSYVADNTDLMFSARNFDFSTLFDAVGENDIGVPRLTDVIFKSVTQWSPEHRFEVLAIHAAEDYYRSAKHVLQSEDYEDVSLLDSEQDSNLLGATWRWSPGDSIQLRNSLYFRNSDKSSSQGEAFPDLVDRNPTPETTPVRPDILRVAEKESEYGWRSDFSTVLASRGVVSAGLRVARVELEFDRRLAGEWIRYVYDASDDRPDPSQQFIVLTPEGVDSQLNAEATQYAAYVDYSHPFGPMTLTPGVRFERDDFSEESLLSPRLSATWQISSTMRAWLGAGVYYQAPRYLELAADPVNARLENERSTQASIGFANYLQDDLRFTAEAYRQRLSNLLVFDDRTTEAGANVGKGSNSGLDLQLSKRMSHGWSAAATYSYSRSRRDDQLGEGEYASDWDRPHSVGLIAAWEPSERWTFSAKWRYASGVPTDAFVSHSDVLAGTQYPYDLRHSKEITGNNSQRLAPFHSLTVRADYHRRFGPVNVTAFVDFLNVYGRKNATALEWDERRGVSVVEGLDDSLPFLGVKFEYSWTVD